MTRRMILAANFILLACAVCFGQTTYMGITPGKSTREDAERILGKPIQEVSKTLIEYNYGHADMKLYVQYRDASPKAITDRIERTCSSKVCRPVYDALEEALAGVVVEATSFKARPDGYVKAFYYGTPRYVIHTYIAKGLDGEMRLAFYSKELYESAVPKTGCTMSLSGSTWDTSRGRMVFVKDGDYALKGTFSNSGTIRLRQPPHKGMSFEGEWKDDTGSGTAELTFLGGDYEEFDGTWKRASGTGPAEERLQGRCVGSAGSGNE